MSFSELILNVLSFLMLIVLAWFSFTVINIAVTIFKCRRKDDSLKFCFNRTGEIVYSVFTVVFIAVYIGGIAAVVYGFNNDSITAYRIAVNVMGLVTLLYSLTLSNIILVGKKELMIGRMLIDYRKMKKVSFTLDDKVTFIFAQKEYTFSTFFADSTEIKRVIKR